MSPHFRLLAAHRAGFTRMILPKRNARDAKEAIGDLAVSILACIGIWWHVLVEGPS